MTNNVDKWEQNIREAKTVLKTSLRSQMEIAKLALEVCEISRGGAGFDGKFTLTRFAKEIAVDLRTLSSWCNVRKNVFLKVDDPLKHTQTYTFLYDIATQVPPNATIKEVTELFRETLSKPRKDQIMVGYIQTLTGLLYNVKNDHHIHQIGKEVLEEVCFYIRSIDTHLVSHKIKAVNHYLTKRNPQSLPGFEVDSYKPREGYRLTNLDKIVILGLEKEKAFTSPTEIGKKVFKEKSPMAAKLTALRSLMKLVQAGVVEKNKHGHYRLSEKHV